MAEREIEVFVQLEGRDLLAGRLWSHRRGRAESATFAYASSYLSHEGAYPLDPALPLTAGQHQTPADREIFGAFSDCAPDRWGRMLIGRRQRKLAGQSTAPSLGEVDYLLGVRDDLRQGALRFRDPAAGVFLADERGAVPQLIDLPRLLDLADRAERDVASEEELAILLRGGSSLGGARPKAHVVGRDGRVAIAKFPRAEGDEWDVIGWEGVALELAREGGIETPRAVLHRFADRRVLVVERFDRLGETRVGYASAMTMLEAKDGEERSYLDLAEVVEAESERATADLQELWRRAAFSVLISNTDNHLRNHGFLHRGAAGWELSPAFDLNPDPQPGLKLLSTGIDGRSNALDLRLLLEVAGLFRLTDEDARRIVSEVSAATAGWREAARRVGLDRDSIARMTPAFEHDSGQLASEIRAATRSA
jgi:serine/threonine-protein kinase HipA